VVDLETFTPVDSEAVQAVRRSPAVAEAQPALQLFGTLRGDEDIDVIVDLLPFGEGALWKPTLSEGSVAAVEQGGIVLSEKAARDLHVEVGGTVRLRHPVREALSYRLVESRVPVAAIHPGALRMQAYLDLGAAGRFNLEGITNALEVAPARGVGEDEAIRALFPITGVAAVRPAAGAAKALRDTLEEFFGVLRVMELIVLLLAVLIAFNAASISMDERRREHATMEAFGLRPRTILGMTTAEGMAAGLLGTALGVAAGQLVVRWMVTAQLDRTMPDLAVEGFVSPATLLTALALGVVAVGAAPLLTARRVRNMDLPATLRVVE
jgi:putative ABC transport system permease protein